ncbi:MAG: SCO family protein [Azonexus sp.]|nr:SCO family protein [Azonexus sp.]
MSERLLAALAALLALILVGVFLFWHPDNGPAQRPVTTLPPGGDFTLMSADGKVSLSDYRGKVTLVYFGYTYCPDICPTSLAATAGGLQMLSADERAKLAMFFVSVDPKRDTPERLKEYASFFDPMIIGMTGTPAAIAEVAGRYGVFYSEQAVETAGDGYVVDHSAETYLIGKDGQLLARIAHATPSDKVAALIRQYLNQP